MRGLALVLILVVFFDAIVGLIPVPRHFALIGGSELAPPDENGQTINPRTRAGTAGLTPAQIRSIYGVSNNATAGSGKTIAVVDAYGCSNIESDLSAFNTKYQLRECTIANKCLKKVNQTGGAILPPDDTAPIPNWCFEASMDVQAVHAMAQGANILYVAATNPNTLYDAIRYAAGNADYVSMSFGGLEGPYSTYYDSTLFSLFPKVGFFASSGDSGSAGGISYPSSSKYVVAVGGTNVDLSSQSVVETGWIGSGGGCSNYTAVLPIQQGKQGYQCTSKKSVPDVAALADPNSGMLGYFGPGCKSPPSCYYKMGGTSLSAPLWAGIVASKSLPTNTSIFNYIYTNVAYRDITSGNNGAYSCGAGLDRVTGLGCWKP